MMLDEQVHENNALERGSRLQLYRKHLIKYFLQTSDYQVFVELLEKELTNYGLSSWSYTSLNLPSGLSVIENLGTINPNVVDAYMEQSLFQFDLAMKHVKLSDKHIFQSDIERQIELTESVSDIFIGQRKIIDLNRKFDHCDICNIPFTRKDGARFLFCVNSKGGQESKFKQHVTENLDQLKVLAIVVNYIGVKKYPEYFLEPIKEFRSVALSQPLNLLSTMVKFDLTVAEGAKKLGITESTATKHLRWIRDKMGAKTNYTAYSLAKEGGYLDVV